MSSLVGLLAQSDEGIGMGAVVICLALAVFVIAGTWKTFEKANQPGWGCIIPIYNVILMLKVAGKPMWWFLLLLIPIVSIIPAIVIPFAIAKNFGQSAVFGLGLLFLPFIFYPVLGFGNAEYDPDVPIF